MRKLSGKKSIGMAAVLLAGALAVTGCGKEAGGTAVSLAPAGNIGEAEPSPTTAGNTGEAVPSPTAAGSTGEAGPSPTAAGSTGEAEPSPAQEGGDDAQNPEGGDSQDTGADIQNPGNDGLQDGDKGSEESAGNLAGSTPDFNYEGLTPADFTIRVADTAGTQLRGTAGRILATGEDIESISRENVIFYFTDEFKERVKEKNAELKERDEISDTAGIVLGAENNIYDIELWIGDECIYTGNLEKYLSYETSGFMGWNCLYDWPYYGDLTLMDDGGVFADRTAYQETAAKLHAFAKAAGLEKESNPIPVTETGWCDTEQEYLIDLDGDGEQEVFFYGQSTLRINGVNYFDQMKYRDNPETTGYFLWDIDTKDQYKEIIIWNHGPSDDDYVDVYYYDGGALKYAGFLQGYPGEVVQDGNGLAKAKCRLGILQTWFAYKDFYLNENHELELAEQALYYAENFWEEEYHYTLLMPICLYETMDENGAYSVLEEGVHVAFPATDDKCFVQVVTEDGRTGFMYLAEGYYIKTPDGEDYTGDEIIDGLNYVD